MSHARQNDFDSGKWVYSWIVFARRAMDSDGCLQDHVNFNINANKANQIKRKYSIDDRIYTPQMVYNNNKKEANSNSNCIAFPNNSAINRIHSDFIGLSFSQQRNVGTIFRIQSVYFSSSPFAEFRALYYFLYAYLCNVRVLMWRRHFIFRQIKFDRLDLTFSLSSFIL